MAIRRSFNKAFLPDGRMNTKMGPQPAVSPLLYMAPPKPKLGGGSGPAPGEESNSPPDVIVPYPRKTQHPGHGGIQLNSHLCGACWLL
jgi:hypothetical protein